MLKQAALCKLIYIPTNFHIETLTLIKLPQLNAAKALLLLSSSLH